MPITPIPAAAEGVSVTKRPMPGLSSDGRSSCRQEGVPSIIKTAVAGIVLAMTITPVISAERTGTVGLVSPAAFAERDDFSRADVVGWATSKISKPDCLAEAQRLQRAGKAALCFLD